MPQEKEEDIILILHEGRQIVENNSDLVNHSLEEVFEILHDLQFEDVRIIWGAIAYLYIKKIDYSSYDGLIKSLKENPPKTMYQEYVVYILQKEYNISVLRLLLEARKLDLSLSSISCVFSNIVFEDPIETNDIIKYLDVICYYNNQTNHLFYMFALFIICRQNIIDVFTAIYNKKNKQYTEFLNLFLEGIYHNSSDVGRKITIFLINQFHTDPYTCELVLKAIHCSIYRDKDIFQNNFSFVLELSENEETWRKIIPIFVSYVQITDDESNIKMDIMKRLKKIPEEEIDDKVIFLKNVSMFTEPKKELKEIIDDIINNITMDSRVLQEICNYYLGILSYGKEGSSEKIIFDQLYKIFINNNYTKEFCQPFFDTLNTLIPYLSKNQQIAWNVFLKFLRGKTDSSIWFSLWIYEQILEIPRSQQIVFDKVESTNFYIFLTKFILYYGDTGNHIMQFIIDITQYISIREIDIYIENCVDEIYSVYPYTSTLIAQEYATGIIPQQKKLAIALIKKHTKFLELQKKKHDIPDFAPSDKRHEVYKDIQLKINRKINKDADEKSLFRHIFSKVVLKYGNKFETTHITKSNKKEYIDQEYSHINFEYELPLTYLRDPLAFYEKRIQIIEDRREFIETDY